MAHSSRTLTVSRSWREVRPIELLAINCYFVFALDIPRSCHTFLDMSFAGRSIRGNGVDDGLKDFGVSGGMEQRWWEWSWGCCLTCWWENNELVAALVTVKSPKISVSAAVNWNWMRFWLLAVSNQSTCFFICCSWTCIMQAICQELRWRKDMAQNHSGRFPGPPADPLIWGSEQTGFGLVTLTRSNSGRVFNGIYRRLLEKRLARVRRCETHASSSFMLFPRRIRTPTFHSLPPGRLPRQEANWIGSRITRQPK